MNVELFFVCLLNESFNCVTSFFSHPGYQSVTTKIMGYLASY